MSKYWIKLWIEILHDDQMGILPDNIWRRAIECFLMAGKIDANGRLPSLRRMARITVQTEENLVNELNYLIKLGIISRDTEGYFVTNFNKRQAAIGVARRVAEYRRRQAENDITKRYKNSNEPVTDVTPEVQKTESTTTTTAAGRLGDYVIKYLSRKGQISSDTTNLVKTLLETYAEADVIYAVDQTERKAANTNDPPTLEYIEAICARRQRGEPDQKLKRSKRKNGADEKRETDPADPDEWDRLLKA